MTNKKTIFIAMPIAEAFEDVHDNIKRAAEEIGMAAYRIDDQESNEKISDRIITAIRTCDFLIADLTDSRPNVFFEAGYALGIHKTPIFIAKEGTKLEFDIHDYPIIFFKNYVGLRDRIKERLTALLDQPVLKDEQVVEAPKRNYSEDDVKALLLDWFKKKEIGEKTNLIEFEKVDLELGIETGSAKKYLEDLVSENLPYKTEKVSEKFISFKYHLAARPSRISPWMSF